MTHQHTEAKIHFP